MRAWLAGADDMGASTFASETPEDAHEPGARRQRRHRRRDGGEGWRSLRLFSSNDYLGMSSHAEVRAAAANAASRWGSGPRSSALVCGYTHEHRVLESGLASLKDAEECLLFPTGYAANLGIIPALCDGPDCHVFSDALNHASIVDGCKLAARRGARVSTYRHCDVGHLEVRRVFFDFVFPLFFPCRTQPSNFPTLRTPAAVYHGSHTTSSLPFRQSLKLAASSLTAAETTKRIPSNTPQR